MKIVGIHNRLQDAMYICTECMYVCMYVCVYVMAYAACELTPITCTSPSIAWKATSIVKQHIYVCIQVESIYVHYIIVYIQTCWGAEQRAHVHVITKIRKSTGNNLGTSIVSILTNHIQYTFNAEGNPIEVHQPDPF